MTRRSNYFTRWIAPWTLSRLGVLGINSRNFRYIQRFNPRSAYPLVDNKLLTKQIVIDHNLQTPQLYGVVSQQHQIAGIHSLLSQYKDFVIKPAHGSGGNGILVICGRQGENYLKASGSVISRAHVERHLSNTLAGLHSLGGQPDKAIIEYRIRPHPFFDSFSFQGVPDIRVLVFLGFPVMAMIRLSTRSSDGKANLHQGAIGVGIRISDGIPLRAIQRNRPIEVHPDTGEALNNLRIENWDALVTAAAECYPATSLGYMGVDLVVDELKGPMILEMNARPGLSIQLANGQGLKPRLRKVETYCRSSQRTPSPADCVTLSKEWFGSTGL